MNRFTDWLLPAVPAARLAVFRAIIYIFVLIDVFAMSNDVVNHGYKPDFYQPTLLPRLLHLPPVSVWGAHTLQVLLIVFCVLGAIGIAQRITTIGVAVCFWLWMMYSQGYGYVAHDHMALMFAVLLIPTAGVIAFSDFRPDRRAGWVLRIVQICVVLTYFYSVLMKWIASGSLIRWANGAVFVWAIMRRGSVFIRWTLEYPGLLIAAQWALLIVEILTPVALFVKGRILYAIVIFFCLFHLATYLSLGIHFLPTVVCWAAFLPLERLLPAYRRHTAPEAEVASA